MTIISPSLPETPEDSCSLSITRNKLTLIFLPLSLVRQDSEVMEQFNNHLLSTLPYIGENGISRTADSYLFHLLGNMPRLEGQGSNKF